jgi:MtN3 and saliva related transmembrane protein
MNVIAVLGTAAAVCSTVSFAPQAWKIIRSRHTADISATMYVITVTGFALWSGYGVMLGQWPLIVSNAICLVMSGFILMMKLLPRRQKEDVGELLDPMD